MNEGLIAVAAVTVALGAYALVRRYGQIERDHPSERVAVAAVERGKALRAEDIVERMSEGVVVLDRSFRPVLSNPPARRILGFADHTAAARLPSEEVLEIAREAVASGTERAEIVSLWYPARSRIKVRATALPDRDGVLVLLEDVTEELLAQQIRREFVAHASHELKSPVASLQTLAEAVAQAVHDDPQAATRFSQRLVSEAARLGRLVGDLLDLSRLEEPAGVPDERLQLSEVAARQLAQIAPAARAKQMNVVERIESDVWVRGDDEQLSLMIRNLLENAVRYTPNGGSITVDVTRVDGSAIVRVADTGIGIPKEAQGRVFERFYRVDRARSRDRGGTGLGLAIVKHVAELHGGCVAVESELGEGSTFTATLPAVDAPDELRPVAG